MCTAKGTLSCTYAGWFEPGLAAAVIISSLGEVGICEGTGLPGPEDRGGGMALEVKVRLRINSWDPIG